MDCEVICTVCGKKFVAQSYAAKFCAKCKKQQTKANRARRAYKKKLQESEDHTDMAIRPVKSARQILQELDKFNRKNGRDLSYGQYVSLLERKAAAQNKPPKCRESRRQIEGKAEAILK